MAQTLTVSTSALASASSNVSGYTKNYSEALASWNTAVGTINTKWAGDESGAVAQFNTAIKNVKDKLTAAESLMTELDGILSAKSADFAEAATTAKNAFNGLV